MPNLFVDVEARYAQFRDALDQLVRHADASSRKMSSAFGLVNKTLAGLGVGLSVAGLVAFSKATIESVARLDDLAEKSALTVETLSQLQEVTRVGGTNLEDAAAIASKFAKSVSAANGGNEQMITFFRQVGISVDDLKNKKFDELFIKFGTTVATAADRENALAVAAKLAGKSASEAMPFFNDLAERGLGSAKVLAENAAAAEKVQKSFRELGLKTAELKDSIVIKLLPGLQAVADEMLNAQRAGEGFIAVMLKGARVAFFGSEQVRAGMEFNSLLKDKIELEEQIGKIEQNSIVKFYSNMTGRKERLNKELQETVGRMKVLADARDKAEIDEFRKGPKADKAKPIIGPVRDDAADKAAAAAAKAAAEAKLRLLETQTKITVDAEKKSATDRLAILERFYKEGLLAESVYWAERAQVQVSAFNVEREALDKEVAARQKAVDIIPKKLQNTKEYFDALKELAEAQAKRNTLDAEFRQTGRITELDKAQAAREYADALKEVKVQLLEIQGKTGEATAERFDKQNEALVRRLKANQDSQGLASVEALRSATVAQAEFNELRSRAADITDSLAISEERIQNSQRVGAISELEALKQTGEARKKSLDSISRMADELDRVAKASGDPKLIIDAERFRLKLEELAGQTELLAAKFNTLFADSIGSALADFATHTKSASEAWNDLVKNITRGLADIAAKAAAAELGFGGKGGGAGGFLAELFGGKRSGTPAGSDDPGKVLGGGGAGIVDWIKDLIGGSFASGIDSVPRDMLAMVHKGERIIPAAANDGGGVVVNMVVNTPDAGSFRKAEGQLGAEVAMTLAAHRRRNG